MTRMIYKKSQKAQPAGDKINEWSAKDCITYEGKM